MYTLCNEDSLVQPFSQAAPGAVYRKFTVPTKITCPPGQHSGTS